MIRRYGLFAALFLLCVMLTPALVLADEGPAYKFGKWNPTGTYVLVSEGSGTLGDDTVFIVQIIPADNRGHHYMGLQQRVNNLEMDFSNIAVELWRTGRSSFDYKMIFYSRFLNDEGQTAIKNGWLLTGVFLRNESGEVWLTDQQMWMSPGCTNMLEPDPSCVMIGPIPLEDGQVDSKMEPGAVASGL